MSGPDGIHWVLVPIRVPSEFKVKHFSATGTCAHGSTESTIISPTSELIARQVDGLAIFHRMELGCTCPHRELVIKTEEGDNAND